jgi:hypothetical protein
LANRQTKRFAVKVERPALTREEAFLSKVDADAWRDLMNALLDKPESSQLDLQDFASGLAESVRSYGGPKTRDAIVHGDAPPDLWVRGRVFGDKWMQDQIRAVLAGKRVR